MRHRLSRLAWLSLAMGLFVFFMTACSDTTFTENAVVRRENQDDIVTGVAGVDDTDDPQDENLPKPRTVNPATGPEEDKERDFRRRRGDATTGDASNDDTSDDEDPESGAGNGGDSENGGPDSDKGTYTRTERAFSLDVSETPLDLVWVVDNSGSMSNEIASVKANLDRFINAIAGRVSLKLMLVTEQGFDDREITLSNVAKNDGHNQIDSEINSHDAMVAAALASCPANTNSRSPKTICNQPVSGFAQVTYSATSGKLAAEFRSEARRVYVFVTDDESKDVTDANFLTLINASGVKYTPSVFGFVGVKSRPGCKIDGAGDSYARLAAATGGAVFDICDPDWSDHFDRLAEQVVVIANSEFQLEQSDIAKIVSITQGGKELPKSAYSLDGSKVTVDPAAMDAKAGDIVIEFDYWQK